VADAVRVRKWDERLLTAGAAVAAGEVWQLADGRAAVYDERLAASSGDRTPFQTSGTYTVTKTTSVVLTDGQPVYWDHSANSATYAPASDRDFFLGACVGDAASADATCQVNINVRPSYKIEMGRNALEDEFLTVVVKTVVGSTTVEVPHLEYWPGAARMVFGATAEAQKVDALSQQGFAVTSNWIVEGGFNVIDDGDATAIDFNIGVANGTHATDADSITESCFLHLDGNTLDLFAESDDGGTEVAATDTTVNIALATPVHFVIDGRNPADVQIYVNGVLMLGSTTFVLTAATGPLKLLAHLEKTSDDTTADYRINYLRVRTAEQD
jgi:predicted RecA/RadA family phage recombinase